MLFRTFYKYRILFIKVLYKYICKTYQIFSSSYEDLFLKNYIIKKGSKKKSIFEFDVDKSSLNEIINKSKIYKVNNYLNLKVLENDQKLVLIKNIFNHNFREEITNLTGFNFSVDFMIFYERKYIPPCERDVPTLQQAYSYRWHFDKPNSSNMLKIFLPVDISSDNGPLEVIDEDTSKKIKNIKLIKERLKKNFLKGDMNKVYGFYPTLCFHKDGIPKENFSGTQIMFQLNPHKEWVINNRLFSKITFDKNKLGIWTTEPKFPLFSYFSNKRLSF